MTPAATLARFSMGLIATALVVALASPALSQASPQDSSQDSSQALSPPWEIRSGGDPTLSEWWRDGGARRWEEIVEYHRWEMERPGSLPYCSSGGEYDALGKGAAREALRAAWEAAPESATAGLYAGLLETGSLSASERMKLLEEGSEVARAEILRRSRWGDDADSVPKLMDAFERSKSTRIRTAAVEGLARAIEDSDSDGVMAAGREWLVEALEDEDLEPTVRLTVLRALVTAAPREPRDESEAKLKMERTQLLRRLAACLRKGPTQHGPATHEVIFSILREHRRWAADAPVLSELEAALTQRVPDAVDQELHGTALVQLARFLALTAPKSTLRSGQEPHSEARAETSFWRMTNALKNHLAQSEAGDGDWSALATHALIEELGASGHSMTSLVPLHRELVRYLARSKEGKSLTPALAYAFGSAQVAREMLRDWVKEASDPTERGARLRHAVVRLQWMTVEQDRDLFEGFESDAKFWRAGAAAVAVMEVRGLKGNHPVVRALRLGREQSWSKEMLVPIVDALGMCATDEAASALLDVLESEARGTRLHERAAWALGRIFERDRHGWSRHPLSASLYPQGS